MHLNRSLLPFLPPILLSAHMAESPHVSRPNLRAQHSLTKNNKHIETIQCLQRPCSRDARLPFFSSGRRPPKLGRRPQCYIFFTFQQCTRWKYKQQTTEDFYCNFSETADSHRVVDTRLQHSKKLQKSDCQAWVAVVVERML